MPFGGPLSLYANILKAFLSHKFHFSNCVFVFTRFVQVRMQAAGSKKVYNGVKTKHLLHS